MKKGSSPRVGRPQRLEFVYFDLDDTLLDHRHAEKAALFDLATELLQVAANSPVVAEIVNDYKARNRSLWAEYSGGLITKNELRRRRFKDVASAFGGGLEWSELDSFYMRRYSTHWRPVEGAFEAFEQVAEKYRVGIITNGFADTQHAKLNRFPRLREVSEAVVISEEVGYLKPDRRLFEFAETLSGVSRGSILYVGDSLRSDVQGALGSGWSAAWYTDGSSGEEPPDRVFAFGDWSHLVGFLG